MKAKFIIAAILLTLGADAAYAQRARVNSDWESVTSDEQKIFGPNARSYRKGNAVVTTGSGLYGRRAYGRDVRHHRRHAER